MQVHVHTGSEIPDSLGFPSSPSIPFPFCFLEVFSSCRSFSLSELLWMSRRHLLCANRSILNLYLQLFLSPALKTCWTASVWEVQRPCPKLSSSLVIVLPSSKPYLNEPHQGLWGSLIHLLPSVSWKITMVDRLWSVKITLWWADGPHCWEAGQLCAAVTPLLPSPILPSICRRLDSRLLYPATASLESPPLSLPYCSSSLNSPGLARAS